VDFAGVLATLTGFLDGSSARYALVGGHALAALGIARTTLDLDLIVDASSQAALIAFLDAEGYETLHRSGGYSNHLHPDRQRGRIDLIYLRGKTADRLFEGCEHRIGPGGVSIPVPKAEHLIAMKLHAIHNDPSRRLRDLADVRSLLALPGVDRAAVREQFEKRGLREDLNAIESQP
jgi:hypothetical protein